MMVQRSSFLFYLDPCSINHYIDGVDFFLLMVFTSALSFVFMLESCISCTAHVFLLIHFYNDSLPYLLLLFTSITSLVMLYFYSRHHSYPRITQTTTLTMWGGTFASYSHSCHNYSFTLSFINVSLLSLHFQPCYILTILID